MIHNHTSPTPDTTQARYDAMLEALDATTKLVLYLKDAVPNSARTQLRSSHLGNTPVRRPASLLESLWNEGHGALRGFAGTVGGLLSVTNLENAQAVGAAEQQLETTRKIYREALEDLVQYAKPFDLDAYGDPIARAPSGCPFSGRHENIEALRNADGFPQARETETRQWWKAFDAADTAYSKAFDDVHTLLAEHTTVPLGWMDATGREQHLLWQTNDGDMAQYLWLLKHIATIGQLNTTKVSGENFELLESLGQANSTIEKIKEKALNHIQTPQLQEHLIDRFIHSREMERVAHQLPNLIQALETLNSPLNEQLDQSTRYVLLHSARALSKQISAFPELAEKMSMNQPWSIKTSRASEQKQPRAL